MRNIGQLREQVVAAEQNYGQFVEQHAKYSKRLIHLVNAIENKIQAPQDEVERQRAEIASLNEENEQLYDIIVTLLQTINAGNLGGLSQTIRELVLKVSCIVEGDPDQGRAPAVEAIAEDTDAVVEPKVSNIAAEASDESTETGAYAETDLPNSPAPAKCELNKLMVRVSDMASKIEVEQSLAGDQRAAENEAENAPLCSRRRIAKR